MLNSDQIALAAQWLDEAERTRTQMKPLTLLLGDMDMQDAYAVQEAWVALKRRRGAQVTGYKIGLTSRAMQQAMNIDTPDYGVLLNEMDFASGSTISAGNFLDPRIEAEFAFVMGKPLFGEDVTLEDVIDATDYVVPVLELISARSVRTDPETGYTRKVFDTIADNAANAGYVLGSVHANPSEIDLRYRGALLYLDGVVEESGLGGAVMDHPAHGIRWVCKRFAPHGIGLEPGQVVLSGSFTRPVPVQAGSEIRADYGELGEVSLSFS